MVHVEPPPATSPEDIPASKPGWKTSEFWLAILGPILSALISYNVFPDDSVWAKVVTICMSLLVALGYQASRTSVKKERLRAYSEYQRLSIRTIKEE